MASVSTNPVEKEHIRIVETIEQSLARGELAQGDRLPSERNLAAEFGVSRMAAREALQLLASRGLIAIKDRSRATILRSGAAGFASGILDTHIQRLVALPNGLADFQEARSIFECGLVRHVARHATPKHIGMLANALVENRRAIGDIAAFTHTDVTFHRILAEVSGNSFVLLIHASIARWIESCREVVLRPRGSMMAAYRNHEAIYQAVLSHDADAAENAMDEHLRTVAKYFFKAHES